MGVRSRLRKETDYETRFRCAGGIGILREEVWLDERGEIAEYNLALILPHVSSVDHGRVLGYDNAHGVHERHFMGEVSVVKHYGYSTIAKRFYKEAEALRKSYEN